MTASSNEEEVSRSLSAHSGSTPISSTDGFLQRILITIFVLEVFTSGRRLKARNELFYLGTGASHPAVELVDDRGRTFYLATS